MSFLDALKSGWSSGDKSSKYLFAILVLLNVVLGISVVRYVTKSNLDSDEVEHAHVTWAINQGIMPFRDIHQNHTPLLWILSSPIVASLPQRVKTLIVLRGLCLLALAGTYIAGLLVLREILGPINRTGALVLLLLILAVFSDFEFYRYRPDPFMTFCVSCAILAAVRMGRAPLWYSTISGIALGLAASFSPKMAPVCLLVPVLCLLECRRQWSLRPLWLAIPNAMGFIAGILPMMAWIISQGLFDLFWKSTVAGNTHYLNLLNPQTWCALEYANLTLALAVFGGLLVVETEPVARKTSWPSASGVLVGAWLAWLILIIEPNHMSYNLQAFAMPAAVLGTVLIMRLAESNAWSWGRRLAIVGVALVFVAERQARQGINLEGLGATIPISDMRGLIDLVPSGQATCVGFAPWHPVFCRDATDLYVHWDLAVLLKDWASPEGKKPFFEMWANAIPVVERGEPSLIVNPATWELAHLNGVLSDRQYDRFLHTMESRYDRVDAGTVSAFVKKKTKGL